jgi:hypothetical protein
VLAVSAGRVCVGSCTGVGTSDSDQGPGRCVDHLPGPPRLTFVSRTVRTGADLEALPGITTVVRGASETCWRLPRPLGVKEASVPLVGTSPLPHGLLNCRKRLGETQLRDLGLLYVNCHRMIQRHRSWPTVDELGARGRGSRLTAMTSAISEQFRSEPPSRCRDLPGRRGRNPQLKPHASVRDDTDGRAASAFTPKRSLVRSQYRPPSPKPPLTSTDRGGFAFRRRAAATADRAPVPETVPKWGSAGHGSSSVVGGRNSPPMSSAARWSRSGMSAE